MMPIINFDLLLLVYVWFIVGLCFGVAVIFSWSIKKECVYVCSCNLVVSGFWWVVLSLILCKLSTPAVGWGVGSIIHSFVVQVVGLGMFLVVFFLRKKYSPGDDERSEHAVRTSELNYYTWVTVLVLAVTTWYICWKKLVTKHSRMSALKIICWHHT
jgi:hypothetical protein